jgi:hypothetical protein
MRLALVLVAFASITFTTGLTPTPAVAQTAPAPRPALPCTGSLNIVRVSEIKPGMMQKFLQAATAQQAWYKKAGTPDQISVMRVMTQDSTTKTWSTSEAEALTSHIEPAARTTGPAHDAGYDAFVALFKESSTIKSEYITCMVKM